MTLFGDDKPIRLLQDSLPQEFVKGEFHRTYAFTLRGARVLAEFYSHERPWPGGHKNVHWWCVIEGGKAVGWNENPGRGWSFPVVKYEYIQPS